MRSLVFGDLHVVDIRRWREAHLRFPAGGDDYVVYVSSYFTFDVFYAFFGMLQIDPFDFYDIVSCFYVIFYFTLDLIYKL